MFGRNPPDHSPFHTQLCIFYIINSETGLQVQAGFDQVPFNSKSEILLFRF